MADELTPDTPEEAQQAQVASDGPRWVLDKREYTPDEVQQAQAEYEAKQAEAKRERERRLMQRSRADREWQTERENRELRSIAEYVVLDAEQHEACPHCGATQRDGAERFEHKVGCVVPKVVALLLRSTQYIPGFGRYQ